MGAFFHEQGLNVVEHGLRVKEERAVDLTFAKTDRRTLAVDGNWQIRGGRVDVATSTTSADAFCDGDGAWLLDSARAARRR